MPKSVDVLLTDDLVDLAKPGDRIGVVGVYRPIARAEGGVTSGVFRFVLVANHVFQLNQQVKAATRELTTAFIRSVLEGDDSGLRDWPLRHAPIVARYVAPAP